MDSRRTENQGLTPAVLREICEYLTLPVYAERMSDTHIRQRLHITGRVQGVGFRPFVYRLAHQHHLRGWVRNEGGEVLLEVEGHAAMVNTFRQALFSQAPAQAEPRLLSDQALPPKGERDFQILSSQPLDGADSGACLPQDSYLCPHCLAELYDPANRRYRYPFINCSHCGPRYTLLDTLPYDRTHTSMRAFPLCPCCAEEYHNPQDRRFHAEPIACPACGPSLYYRDAHGDIHDNEPALAAALALLRGGGVLALKGVGAYQLLCDAHNETAVERLRQRKQRPHKPLALMFPERGADGLAALASIAPNTLQGHLLRSPLRPIVLCPANTADLPGIAPGLSEIGVMLPGSPLHSLLLNDFDGPLVATSANPSGEPVVYQEHEAETRLGHIADGFLHHNRPILQRADDPVYRIIAGQPRPLRPGRGNAPVELHLPRPMAIPTLALGGHMKNTVALAWGERCVLSPHIGELDSPRALIEFTHSIDALQRLYRIKAMQLVVDAHPGYGYWPWARQSGLPIHTVFHHHAHASAVYGEYPQAHGKDWLIFTWDGSGLGADGGLWGGEGLLGQPGQWRHFSQMRRLRLPGGEQAAREGWRCAASLCWESGSEPPLQHPQQALLKHAWQRGINAPWSSAVGRLFDAAASLCGLCQQSSYEGQAAMLLEACAASTPCIVTPTLPLQMSRGIWQWDWQPLLTMLTNSRLPIAERARAFHQSLADSLLQQALRARQQYAIDTIGLSGGVFQNRLLTELACSLLQKHHFQVYLPQQIPANDAGLAWGQICEINLLSDRGIHSAQPD